MDEKTFFQSNILVIIAVTLIVTIIFVTPTINVNAEPNNQSYGCNYIPGSGTIGQVECCTLEASTDTVWCTTCDNTHPPSNCSEREPTYPPKVGDNKIHTKNDGGVLSQNDDSSNQGGSNTVDPDKIIEEGTFNDGSGSSNSDDSSGGIDSSKINSGAVFNQ